MHESESTNYIFRVRKRQGKKNPTVFSTVTPLMCSAAPLNKSPQNDCISEDHIPSGTFLFFKEAILALTFSTQVKLGVPPVAPGALIPWRAWNLGLITISDWSTLYPSAARKQQINAKKQTLLLTDILKLWQRGAALIPPLAAKLRTGWLLFSCGRVWRCCFWWDYFAYTSKRSKKNAAKLTLIIA